MSDVSQGPGWWLASDYKWYPPELHPDYLAAQGGAEEEPGEEPGREAGREAATGPEVTAQAATGQVATEAAPAGETARSDRSTAPVRETAAAPTTAGQAPTGEPEISAPAEPSVPTEEPERATGAGASAGAGAGHARARSRRDRSSLVVLVALIVLIFVGVITYELTRGSSTTSGTSTNLTSDSPSQIITLATTAMQTSGSVHVSTSIRAAGQVTTYVNDTAMGYGQQVITAGTARVTTMEVGGIAYVNANSDALTALFGRPVATAQQFAGRWMSFPSTDVAYKQIVSTLTLGSLIQQITPTGTLTKTSTTVIDGKPVIGIEGALPANQTGTLYVATQGSPLPVEEISSNAGGSTTSLFGGWGEHLSLTAPTGAVPASAAGL